MKYSPLIEWKGFIAHNGDYLDYKLECDVFGPSDWVAIAKLISRSFKFKEVQGVPFGGIALEKALKPYACPLVTTLPLLLVDDVLTTGSSIYDWRKIAAERHKVRLEEIQAVVLFSRLERSQVPDWVTPIFQMSSRFCT